MAKNFADRTLLRYALAQLPGAALLASGLLLVRHWHPFPGWLFWTILLSWLAKDAALYPVLRPTYANTPQPSAGSLTGARGVACERLDPVGYIRVRGELWRAEIPAGAAPVEAGGEVVVRGRRDLTLLVEGTVQGKATGKE